MLVETTKRGKLIRVAIVGGGCAGIAAAWQLSQQRGYEIHLYEKTWRLGGKGGSVRDADGRILEHGLHVWLGFYENAFRMMRECYAEVEGRKWGPNPEAPEKLVHGRIDDAFFPEPNIGAARPNPPGDWAAWTGYFPPAEGLPGGVLDERTNPFTLANYLLRCFDLLKTLMLSVIGPPDVGEQHEPINPDGSDEGTHALKVLIEHTARLLRAGALTGAAALSQAVALLEAFLARSKFAPEVTASALQLMEAVAAQTRKMLSDFVAIDEKIRMKTEVIDIVMTIAVGLFRDRVLFDDKGLDSINQVDYREWLLKHGATKTSVNSRFVSAAYDLVFAYREGDKKQPALAAGVALRGAMRMFFTYRGSMFWRLRSGMGDAVFAPLYKVLLLRDRKVTGEQGAPRDASPVTFHFLHELETVRFDAGADGGRYVSSMTFRTMGDWAKLDARSLQALDDFGCWPDGPGRRFDQDGGIGSRTLYLGEHFDGVIFALGIDDFKRVFADALKLNLDDFNRLEGYSGPTLPAEWTAMCAEVKTAATQTAQVWLDKDLEGLGWYRGSGLIAALNLSFDTWADMTHTLATERAWRRQKSQNRFNDARSVAYFCAALPQSEIEALRQMVHARLENAMRRVVGETPDGEREALDVGVTLTAITAIADDLSGAPLRTELRGRIENELVGMMRVSGEWRASSEGFFGLLLAAFGRIESYLVQAVLESKVNDNLTRMLQEQMRPVWPAAFDAAFTASTFEIGRHVQANFDGSDRYTLSLPGSLTHRISPLDRSVQNMTIAGDWTACGLDLGCIEAAVMSGMLAAYAISGKPDPESIIGYDHP